MRFVVLAVIALAAPAAAEVAGFVTAGSGQLSGRVVDKAGKPARDAKVHVVTSKGAEQVVSTNRDGRYRATLAGGDYSLVFVHGDLRITGQVAVATADGDTEVVEIREAIPPAVPAKPRTNPRMIPSYSDAAIDRNAWVRAWVLLDISDRGAVTRVKLVNRPGYDLDRIALREAFALKFEAARDRAGRPTRSLLVWSFEWPAYWWMLQHKHDLRRIPPEALAVPCLGSGPSARTRYRDCSQPDIASTVSQPWREKP